MRLPQSKRAKQLAAWQADTDRAIAALRTAVARIESSSGEATAAVATRTEAIELTLRSALGLKVEPRRPS